MFQLKGDNLTVDALRVAVHILDQRGDWFEELRKRVQDTRYGLRPVIPEEEDALEQLWKERVEMESAGASWETMAAALEKIVKGYENCSRGQHYQVALLAPVPKVFPG